ncbi:MAG: hypothetical protein M1828_001512 [Chrysothrix sp. TS-e1954]|nr:MAG: hypothetical protein M1828_001512 [Chrysothrix sp. TS-e1954]
MEDVNVPELIQQLEADDGPTQKMAAFKLQGVIQDPSFADLFIQEGGLPRLRSVALSASGNTLAYSLASFTNLLGLDQGWEYINSDLVLRLVQLIVRHPLVNILRGAMAILTLIVAHAQDASTEEDVFGYRAVKSAMEIHPQFLEVLVSKLSSGDHALCVNALQLINALMRDSMQNYGDSEWPSFVKHVQDLGVIDALYGLISSSSLQDMAHPLFEFQELMKVLLRKWREVPVEPEKSDHRRVLRKLYAASQSSPLGADQKDANRHDPASWRRIGFESETPGEEFYSVGYLGVMDLMSYVDQGHEAFQRLLQEQAAKPVEDRCPVARASITVTFALCDHFDVLQADLNESQRYAALDSSNYDKVFHPMILQWSRLHTSGVQAFLRLWAVSGAQAEDFDKIASLVSILVMHVLSLSARTKDIAQVQEDIAAFELHRLREIQMELAGLMHEQTWGHHLRTVKYNLRQEAFQFIKEQRIRCLLHGSWFPNPRNTSVDEESRLSNVQNGRPSSWRFARLSHNRRVLHYDDFDFQTPAGQEPALEALEYKLELSSIHSVVSHLIEDIGSAMSDSVSTLRSPARSNAHKPLTSNTQHVQRIVINGRADSTDPIKQQSKVSAHQRERSAATIKPAPDDAEVISLLILHPTSHTLAAEWIDGLLMLLGQEPITPETKKLVEFVSSYGLRIRLLNVRNEETIGISGEADAALAAKEITIPSREGLDDDFYYRVVEM